jgi:hypothetical protein
MNHENPTKNAHSSEFEVDGWAVSQFVMQKLVPVVGTHPFPLNELMLLTATVCRFEPPQIFDWGTHVGKSARIFHECTTHYRIDAEIHSTDLSDEADHPEHPGSQHGIMVKGLPNVILHRGDGVTVSMELWRSSGRQSGPLFFLDGDHRYESVARELEAIMGEIPSAVVLVHDSFYQSSDAGYNIGPYRAIEEALANRAGKYHVLNSGLGLPGLTLLYPSVG